MLYLKQNKRILIFLIGCMTIRSIPIYIVLQQNPILSNLSLLFYFIIGLSFMKTWVAPKHKTGFFGGTIWWHHLRLLHSTNYLLFVGLFILTKKYYTKILVFDLFVSLISFAVHYSTL
jgi:hypothetical protein